MRLGVVVSAVILVALIASPLHLSELPPPQISPAEAVEVPQEESMPGDEQDPAIPDAETDPIEMSAETLRQDVPVEAPAQAVTKPPVRPYDSPPQDLDTINTLTRASLINILCIGSPPLRSTSGTGILVGSDGTILTNAHIGQYVLLADSGLSVTCTARIGSPAMAEWPLETVFLPPKWAQEHARSLTETLAKGTGEEDYAILRVVRDVGDTHELPYLPIDSRQDALTEGSLVLAAYPAEFMSGADVQRFLYAQSTFVTIRDIYTFSSGTLDVVSLGSNPLAQQGSSGGALVNPWGYLIGIITTTTVGDTTGERDLRAITLGHVERSLSSYRLSLAEMISREPSTLLTATQSTSRAADSLKAALVTH